MTIVFRFPSSRCYSEERRTQRNLVRKKGRSRTHARKNAAHRSLPVFSCRRSLRNEHVIGSGSDSCHQSEPSTVTTHDFDNESSRVRRGSRGNAVDGFADSVKRSGSTCSKLIQSELSQSTRTDPSLTDSHISSCHIVIDTSNESDDVEVLVSVELLLSDVAWK